MKKPEERFTETVENYLRYRPHYPQEVLQFIVDECQFTKSHIIADIGSGTGFLSQLFLDFGCTVYGVEPNQAMREAAEEYLAEHSKFVSVAGYAEATTLATQSIDWITVGTAFHWFDVMKAKREFKRILKLPGFVLLVWNVKNTEQSKLMQDYENLSLIYGTDYRGSRAQEFEKTAICDFFMPYEMKTKSFINKQQFDWEGFKGRLLSASYSLRESAPEFDNMLHALREIFDRHQQDGMVKFLYTTKLYYGQMTP